MPDPLLWTLQGLLVVVFAWAALAKIVQWSAWRSSLGAYGIPGRLVNPVAVTVPLAEIGLAALILSGATRVAMAATLALLAFFCLAVLRARARQGDRLPCGCFGKTEARDYRLMLVRNGLLGALAGVVLVTGDEGSPISSAEVPTAGEVIPAILVVAGALLVVWMLRYATHLMKRREHM